MNIKPIKSTCPFCDSTAIIIDDDEWTNTLYVVCLDCDGMPETSEYISDESIEFYESIGYKIAKGSKPGI